MQWKPATTEKSTAHCLASMIRCHWCRMYQGQISMLWLCPACIVMQMLQKKCTSRRWCCIKMPPRVEWTTSTTYPLCTPPGGRKVNRWPVVLFGNCIDVGAVAAFIIWLFWVKSFEGRRRLFLLELAHGLIMPQVRRRSLLPILQALIRLAMKMVGVVAPGQPQQAQQGVGVAKRRICCLCPRQVDKKGCNVGHAENMYVPITTPNKLCANTFYKSRNGRLFNLKESIPSFLQDMMIDIQFILLTIFYIIVWYIIMPLFSSEHVKCQY